VDFGQDEEISATKIMEHGQNTIAILSLLIVYISAGLGGLII
jgi:hypothetical protein